MDRETVGIAILATAIAGGIAWWHAPPNRAAYTQTPITRLPVATITPDPVESIWVQVSGAVHQPQSIQLPKGSRVKDAVAQAGGPLRNADTSALNWVGKLRDGQQVRVPFSKPAIQGPLQSQKRSKAGTRSTTESIEINTASHAELIRHFGFSKSQATLIIQYRNTHGAIRDDWELDRVLDQDSSSRSKPHRHR